MRVLFVTSEVAGLYKLGGLGDVSSSLPVALSTLGLRVTVTLPYYEEIDVSSRCLGKLSVDFADEREIVFLFVTTLPHSDVPVLLFRHPRLMKYHAADMTKAFAFYDKAIASYLLADGRYDIIHCHDWHTSLVPILVGESHKLKPAHETIQSKRFKTILTIHNLLYQGKAPATLLGSLGLSPKSVTLSSDHSHHFFFLREGLSYADLVTTVSPTYASEITTPQFGQGFEKLLSARGVRGILNGIDETIWNPETDKHLSRRYGPRSAKAGKAAAKAAIRVRLRLAGHPVPLLGFVGRLDPTQKGIDILLDALPHVLPWHDFQLVILGTGDGRIEEHLSQLTKRFTAVRFVDRFDEELSHLVYAASDMMVVPSRFEPCGLIQLLAMRYGAVPIVRRTGGLVDTVTHGQTGFVFDEYTGRALARAIEAAVAVWRDEPAGWTRLVTNAMRANFSWTKSARAYRELYAGLLK